MSPALIEPKGDSTAVRLQLRMTSSPGLGVDVEEDKVTVNEAIGPQKKERRETKT